uniref:S-formylglutathione hydrolase n=1 Tax=Globisporangium ultimum (strain ATCC 200006 / CBS 805.95 / DAOM BR144) TaxID=431595 RepID=K3WZH1_GLOUD
MQLVKQVKLFGGVVKQFSHESATTKCTMKFSVFLPPNASETHKVPVLFYLAGLTCNDELLFIKAPNAAKIAAARGIAIVTTDTSPRGVNIEGEDDSWDFGSAAGFYLDATEPKWEEYYRMYTYVTKELPSLITANFPVLEDKHSIMGHSMGGHGALTLGIRNPDQYKSISAFAPISHPSQCPWGIKAFTGYLGPDQESWKQYDATHLILKHGPVPAPILIDQGSEDQFLHDKQLLPEAFEAAAQKVNQKATVRSQEGYDHSYYFISSFVEEHVNFHADALLP